MATLYFLGTGAALPTADRANTALAVLGDQPEQGLLIDCGSGIYQSLLGAGLQADSVADLFITHAHIDHIGDLPSLIESFRLGGRSRPLTIYAIPEVLEVARRLVEVFSFELTLSRWTFEVHFEAIEPGETLQIGGFQGQIVRMDHAVPSAGIRLELPHGALAYTCDTQPTPAIVELGRGAQTLVTECTHLQRGEQAARRAKHMTSVEAGQQAELCGARRLALVHLGVAEGWTPQQAIAETATAFTGEVLLLEDGQSITV